MKADRLDAPPCRYAVLVLGSGGRGQSLLAADQDNAIVFERGEPEGAEDKWFAELGERIATTLDEASIPLCKGGIMAKSADWRGNAELWRERIADWVRRASPADLLNVDIVFEHPGEATFPVSTFVCRRGGMVVFCAGTTGYNLTMDARYVWMHQKRIQGSHFAHLKQAASANRLMIERRIDPCMSELFPWAEIPSAHLKMRRNEHKPGNMAVLVQSPKAGLRTLKDAIEADPAK